KQVYDEISRCRKCRDLEPALAALPEEEFCFRWEPYWRGNPPLRYLFLAWEPTLPSGEHAPVQGRDVGSFNEPLNYAIRQFLESDDRYAITNMAKCSMSTGRLADRTRQIRFETCNSFLQREIKLAAAAAVLPLIISIGRKPKEFLQQHREFLTAIGDHKIHQITHYSRTATPHFVAFATDRAAKYREFCDHIGVAYEEWLAERHARWLKNR